MGRMNPSWNITVTDEERQAAFEKASLLTGEDFTYFVEEAATSWLPAKKIVERSIASRFDAHPSGEIVVLEQFAPWGDHLFSIEKEQDLKPLLVYLVFADSGGSWRVRAVPDVEGSFSNRVPLAEPMAWIAK